jgi:translation initiation factor 2 subunit 2
MDYEQMLKKAYSSLPEKALKRERFEIPVAETLEQGNRTIIKNFDAMCRTLRRAPDEVSKYLFRELATAGSIEGDRLLLTGRFTERVVNEKIKNFTEGYVLCKACGKPDTRIADLGRGIRELVCEACGARSALKLSR